MVTFYVIDEAGKDRYMGSDIVAAYEQWHQLAIRLEADMTDADGVPITDMDCGGGSQMYWKHDDGEYVSMHDSACGRKWCWDCNEFDPTSNDVPEYDVA